MRIAIASDDGKQVAFHLGRCKGFVVSELENEQELQRRYVENTFARTHHFSRRHLHQHEDQHSHHHNNHHNHRGLFDILDGCDMVISRGMGLRLYEDLKTHGFHVVTTKVATVDEVIQQVISGTLQNEAENGCCLHE